MLVSMTAQAARAQPSPIVVLRSVNRDGETYALEPRSLERLRQELGAAVHARPRIFIAHETRADYERHPVTERDLPLSATFPAA
jgi:hypothetical protein